MSFLDVLFLVSGLHGDGDVVLEMRLMESFRRGEATTPGISKLVEKFWGFCGIFRAAETYTVLCAL